MTLQQEIEKILTDNNEELWGIMSEDATKQLQKLFLTKQIELLNEIGANGAIIYEADILKKKLSLFSELKALQ